MSKSRFVYVTYIRTSPEKLWEALTSPEFNKKYWFGAHQESEWSAGSPWKIVGKDGGLMDSGEILEVEPAKRLVIKWRNEFKPEYKAEGYTRCTFDIEQQSDSVRLSVVHEADVDASKVIGGVSQGWPIILSGLKTLLETGTPLARAQ